MSENLGSRIRKRTPTRNAASVQSTRDFEGRVPAGRRSEIQRYLELFGYKPEKTILQVHIPGFFNKRRGGGKDKKKRAAPDRYRGTTFLVVGRTHDPAIMDVVLKPRKNSDLASPGYVGYLWKGKNIENKAPHELVPLDFTPMQLRYPQEWKHEFGTRGFMIAMHVPSLFAPSKNRLSRALYRIGKNADVKEDWTFLDQLQEFGYPNFQQTVDEESLSAAANSKATNRPPRQEVA